MLNVTETLKDRKILFVGATGFVGKVALSMLLRRYPDVGKVFVLVRPGAGSTSEQRFFTKIVKSPTFDPIREQWGAGTEAFLREKVVPLAGDAARPNLNFTDEDFVKFGKIDVLINCAGLVSFTPSLETALRINTHGVRNVRDVARKIGAGVVHVSTCFVAGNRSGDIWEDEPVDGYYPRRGELRDEDFQVDAEISDCERLVAQVKALADDRAHISLFRDRAAKRLEEDGRDPDDENVLKLAVARERKMWVAQRLTDLGMERAKHWGWPNIYTYTKSLGDQVLASAGDLNYALVRPSIVETAVRYPFKGWNEGFTTSAPLCYMALKGHRTFASHPKANLDVVPVDLVGAAIVGAAAAVVAGTNKHVYHASTSDTSPLPVPRAIELLGLYARKHWKTKETGNEFLNALRSRLEMVPVSKERFNAVSAPAVKVVAHALTALIDRALPKWGAPRLTELAGDVKAKLAEIERQTGQIDDAFQLFLPFIHDNHYVFRSDNLRELFASMTPEDRAALVWDPENIEWREYWLENHLPGLKKWVFPNLEEEYKAKPRSVYTYKDLLEMFDRAVKHHRSRVAMRLLPPTGSDDAVRRYTYRQLGDQATRAGAILSGDGIGKDDKVLLLAENRPEWGITYFGILKAGGVVVPMDWNATIDEVVNVARSSRAKAIVLSDRVRERLTDLHARLVKENLVVKLVGFDELTLAEPRRAAGAVEASPKGDDLASLIFTSGTTGNPKGVMLSHRNFTSLLSKLVAVFDLQAHDKLLSVLPLHHTFEFTAGLLMPMMRGASVTYLDEVNPENLEAAFEGGEYSGMIGVPALWQLLHRKIKKNVADRGAWAEEIFDAVVEGSRKFRDKTGLNVAKFVFYPVQKRLGGRMTLMISGGSALPPDVMKTFRGLGFSLFEGYGLTEASPVLSVQRPGTDIEPGSVGEPLPGIEMKIADPDANGVGEIIANGPNVMLGYFENPEATGEVIKNGWLHTGDLGKMDENRRITIVGRKKEMILASNGENVYPDELEELYRDSPYVKELSIVGLPENDGGEGAGGGTGIGELVGCLVVPDYEPKGDEMATRAVVRERVQTHMKEVSAKLPHYKRVKVLHLWDHDLPRTATRKVKRKLVVGELQKLQRAAEKGAAAAAAAKAGGGAGGQAGGVEDWLIECIASVCQKPKDRVTAETKLAELGFDSLMYAELGVALEAAGVQVGEEENLQGIGTVDDLAKLVATKRRGGKVSGSVARVGAGARKSASGNGGHGDARIVKKKPKQDDSSTTEQLYVPQPLVDIGRRVLTFGQRMTYEKVFETKVTGAAHLPQRGPFLVAANHASHLDMGLVKHALGDWGPHLVALAAKDYFFEDRLKRAYFENFTNLLPMDRHGSLRESLRLASRVLHEGHILLIFPEGTRSETGVMTDFKASIGYLALANKVDVVPMYLEGTYDALPKGATLPKNREIAAHIGPLLTYEKLRAASEGMPKSEQYREAARLVETAVRKLGKLPPPPRRLAVPPADKRPGSEHGPGEDVA